MSKSRLEKFLYALYSLDSSDLPTPLSRIEELYKCWVTGEEAPTFKPLSRVEKYLMAILGVYNVDELPNPLSRVEVLLHKLAIGDDSLEDFDTFLSEHEELLAEIIRNGGVGGNIDIEYVLYTLSTEFNTLYNTEEKPVKSAILKGSTKYRDIDTGDILDTFDETKNLELVSVKMPVLTTVGKNLFDKTKIIFDKLIDLNTGNIYDDHATNTTDFIKVIPNTQYTMSFNFETIAWTRAFGFTEPKHYKYATDVNGVSDKCYFDSASKTITFTTSPTTKYLLFSFGKGVEESFQLEQGSTATSYEPYKSNILTVNEEVELRRVGNVKDELNLITGELTQRIGSSIIDGSNSVVINSAANQNTTIGFDLGGTPNSNSDYSLVNITSDKFRAYSGSYLYGTDIEGISNAWNATLLRINRDRLNTPDANGLKQWLTENPIKLTYIYDKDSIKTVDLSVVDQDGNNTELSTFNDITYVILSSEGLIPEAELKVATKNKEVLSTMSLEMNDISTTQNALQETSDIQSENIDATMIATTEIYEGLL